MATPFLAALRAHWPQAHLALVGPSHARPILEGLSSFDVLHELPVRTLSTLFGAASKLRDEQFDLGVLLTNSFSSALIFALAKIPMRVGYGGGGRGALLTHTLPVPRARGRHRLPIPMVQHYAALLDELAVPRGSHRTQLATTQRDEQRAEEWLARHELLDRGPLFGIHPGSSFGPSKLWLPERFAELADRLHAQHGGRMLVFCGPTEHELARSIAASASSPVFAAAEDPIGLDVLKAVIRRLSLLISTDTGPRHFAAPFDVPCVVLMGATDPRFTNTNLARSRVVRSAVECSPCQLRVCPIDHRCMTRLSVDQVAAAARQLISAS